MKNKFDAYRKNLTELRDRLQRMSRIWRAKAPTGRTSAGGSTSAMPIHMADAAPTPTSRRTPQPDGQSGQVLEQIGAALDRIKEGTFGRCEECEKDIPSARLEVLPYARYCVSCAEKLERRR